MKPANSAITNEEKTAVASAQLESGDKISNKATPLKSPDSAINNHIYFRQWESRKERLFLSQCETNQEAPLFNPRRQKWSEHFEWAENHTQIRGLTPIGQAREGFRVLFFLYGQPKGQGYAARRVLPADKEWQGVVQAGLVAKQIVS